MLADATSGMKHLLKHGEKFATRRVLCDRCGTDAQVLDVFNARMPSLVTWGSVSWSPVT